jgi:hypothetical protein
MRSRTPPLLKWLLVERATLAGDVARAHEQEADVNRELTVVQARLTVLAQDVERLQLYRTRLPCVLREMQSRMAALDTAIGLASMDQVEPAAAGIVRSFAGRYGKRGDSSAR